MSVRSYSKGSIFLHWLIAIIVIPMLLFSFFLDDVPESMSKLAIMMHKSFGMTVLVLMIIRIVWLSKQGKPSLPESVPVWQRIASRLVQHALYISVIAMPLVGWIMSTAAQKAPVWFGLVKISLPGIPHNKVLAKNMFQMHQILAWIILGLLFLHISAALKHHFIDKDNVLKRMLGISD